MAIVSLNIPNEYVPRLLTAIKEVYPIPQIKNPAYDPVLENDPDPNPSDPNPSNYVYSYNVPKYINEYSDVAWTKKKLIDFLGNTLRRYEERQGIIAAKNNVNIPSDLAD